MEEPNGLNAQYFTHEVHFTNPERIYFIEKSTDIVDAFFWLSRS